VSFTAQSSNSAYRLEHKVNICLTGVWKIPGIIYSAESWLHVPFIAGSWDSSVTWMESSAVSLMVITLNNFKGVILPLRTIRTKSNIQVKYCHIAKLLKLDKCRLGNIFYSPLSLIGSRLFEISNLISCTDIWQNLYSLPGLSTGTKRNCWMKNKPG
jgi:hypothetical protein